MRQALESFADLMHRGGLVMWPLLALSLVGLTLILERAWFWLRTNRPSNLRQVERMAMLLRKGDVAGARLLAEGDEGIYSRVVLGLLSEERSEAAAAEAVESQRRVIERFMPTLSTIITAAPMLGILGTVTGIITSFQVLSDQATATDPRRVSSGIAEALLTTAVGLVVAIGVLFPYNAFRAQIDRALGRIELLIAAAMPRQKSTFVADPQANSLPISSAKSDQTVKPD